MLELLGSIWEVIKGIFTWAGMFIEGIIEIIINLINGA